MFIIALSASAFTRFKSESKAFGAEMYYANGVGPCEYMYVIDANCVTNQLNYICIEQTRDAGWKVMLQKAVGYTCLVPFYSYYTN